MLDNEATARQSGGAPSRVGTLEIFLTFTRISLSGFGGTLFWARRILVEDKRWLTEREFVETMSLGQILPGPSLCNVSVMIGHRFAGYAGSVAALSGFMGWPIMIVIGLGLLYQRFGAQPVVQHALAGMSSIAAGLILANAVKMATVLPRRFRPWLFLALAFAGVGALRLPLVWILATLAPIALLLAWRELR